MIRIRVLSEPGHNDKPRPIIIRTKGSNPQFSLKPSNKHRENDEQHKERLRNQAGNDLILNAKSCR